MYNVLKMKDREHLENHAVNHLEQVINSGDSSIDQQTEAAKTLLEHLRGRYTNGYPKTR